MEPGLKADPKRYNLPAIRKAAKITHAAFRDISKYIVLGINERQLAWRMGRLLQKYGSEKRAFPVIAAFGPSAAEPHHVPTSRRLKDGQMIKIDAGAVYNDMRGDITRTFFFGKPTTKFLNRYNAVLTAQKRSFKYMKAGVSGKKIDSIARNYLKKKNYHKLFIHGLGHGVGRAIHQPPSLTPSKRGERVLQVGEVVTNEPGIYEKGWGGIRIEDMVEITSSEPRWLGDQAELTVLK
ncbi:MAG: M24 family metallopeptidase [bacterium]|nr:M24 family metallopeptidase [bacterium]